MLYSDKFVTFAVKIIEQLGGLRVQDTLALGRQREEVRRDILPLKGLKVREESEGSPKPKDKVQRIVRAVTGARDRKSEVHKTKGTRAEYGDGDGEQCDRR